MYNELVVNQESQVCHNPTHHFRSPITNVTPLKSLWDNWIHFLFPHRSDFSLDITCIYILIGVKQCETYRPEMDEK